jgi:16S rRNA processing protein RimM
LAVGRIGRPHGIRGEVHVVVLTDAPELRFQVGASLDVLEEPGRRLEITAARWHHGRLLAGFAGVGSREEAESLRGNHLSVDLADLGDAGDEAWWDHELEGLPVSLADGRPLGTLREVLHATGQDLLAVDRAEGGEVLIPFVRAFVPVVDPAGRRVVVAPPEGLLDL